MLQRRAVVRLVGCRRKDAIPEGNFVPVFDDGENLRVRLEDVAPKGEMLRVGDAAGYKVVGDVRED